MKQCAYCGKPVETGLVVHSDCVAEIHKLREEADENAALAIRAKMRVDEVRRETANSLLTKILLNFYVSTQAVDDLLRLAAEYGVEVE